MEKEPKVIIDDDMNGPTEAATEEIVPTPPPIPLLDTMLAQERLNYILSLCSDELAREIKEAVALYPEGRERDAIVRQFEHFAFTAGLKKGLDPGERTMFEGIFRSSAKDLLIPQLTPLSDDEAV